MLAEDEELKRTEGRNVKREFAGKLCEMVIVCYLFMFVLDYVSLCFTFMVYFIEWSSE